MDIVHLYKGASLIVMVPTFDSTTEGGEVKGPNQVQLCAMKDLFPLRFSSRFEQRFFRMVQWCEV
jgi:hypothetical protein